jgi:predicted TIM-barrel fold metal-dependent hydrolase
MIIDCHTHIYETGSGGPFNLPSTAADLVREMDAAGVDLSLILPLSSMAGNAFVADACAEFPDRLAALYNPDFTQPGTTIANMQSFFEVYAPKGLKIHPRHQGITVRDEVMLEVLHWAEERGLPVLFDVFQFGPSLDDDGMRPMAYHAVAQKLPGLKMILAHAGGFRILEAFMVAKSNPNVFLDLSFTPAYFQGSSVAADCGFVCRRLPPGRVFYGSDFPFVPFAESIEHAHRAVGNPGLDTDREFWGDGAARVFGLSKV